MTSCNSGLGFEPTLSPIPTVLTTPTATATLTPTPTASSTPTVTFTPTATEIPYLTLVFYGDSDTAVGEMGDGKKHGGYSYVTDLSPMLPVSYTLVISNHGGRTAKWGYNHLEDDVLNFHPDVVTVWWGLNDLYSCPGIFDRGSNRLIQYQLDLLVAEHTRYLKMQIDVLLAHGTSVYLMTTFPVLVGQLPWSHIDENNNEVWEQGRWCNYNQGLIALVETQRKLVAQYQADGKKVYLVDIWQLYMDHPDLDGMYWDDVHPGSYGAQLIAKEWFKVFEASQK